MSFATLSVRSVPSLTLSFSDQLKHLFSEMRCYLQAAEGQLPGITRLAKPQRSQIYDKVKAANEIAGKIQKLVKTQQVAEFRTVCDKARRDLEREMGRLTKITNALYRAEQTMSDSSSEEGGEKDSFLTEPKEAQTDVFEVQIHEDILMERDQKITHITSAIQQVNGLFKEISLMVNEQGEALDRIEDHIGDSVQQTKKTVQELQKAEDRTKANKRRQCCLVLLTVLMLLLVSLFSGMYWKRK